MVTKLGHVVFTGVAASFLTVRLTVSSIREKKKKDDV